MDELADFLQNEFPEGLTIQTPQFERLVPREYDFVPTTEKEFLSIVERAPLNILKGLGFSIWDKYNNIADENAKKPVSNKISIPILNAPGQDFEFDTGRGDAPTKRLDKEYDIWLLPYEWYNSIPEGFELICISGRKEQFKKGVTDDDMRFGCLAYGILRESEDNNNNQ